MMFIQWCLQVERIGIFLEKVYKLYIQYILFSILVIFNRYFFFEICLSRCIQIWVVFFYCYRVDYYRKVIGEFF